MICTNDHSHFHSTSFGNPFMLRSGADVISLCNIPVALKFLQEIRVVVCQRKLTNEK